MFFYIQPLKNINFQFFLGFLKSKKYTLIFRENMFLRKRLSLFQIFIPNLIVYDFLLNFCKSQMKACSLSCPKHQEKVKNVHFYYLFLMVETENTSLSSEKSVLYKKMSVFACGI